MRVRRNIAIILICVWILILSGGHYRAYGQDIEDNSVDIIELETIIRELNKDIKAREARLREVDAELKKTEAELTQTEKDLVASQASMEEKNLAFSERLRSAYMKGGLSYLEVLLEADNFGDLIIRVTYLARIFNKDAELIAAVKAEFAILQERQAAIQVQRDSIADLRFQMEAERKNLVAQRREHEAMLKSAQDELKEDNTPTPQAERKPAYGVVLDNAPGARPQHGISQATVVYEYEVEGRITRLLALFSSFPSKVGPIRSAREHSIMLAMENNIHYIYASGSKDNLERIADWNVKGTNGLYSSHSSFYRDSARKAPHNFYVNLSTLNAAAASSQVVIRPAFIARQGTSAQSFSLQYSGSYRVGYQYDATAGAYRRSINGQAQKDASGKTIMARNIFVQYVPHPTDSKGRTTPQIIGSGAIDYYVQGQRFKGTWSKDSASSPTRFYYQDGQEIERIYGQTWIQLARS
jgi:hypothetical protein